MQLKVKKSFKWAHRHVDVQEHNVGDVIETEDQDLIRVAIDEGWVTKNKEPKLEVYKERPAANQDDLDPVASHTVEPSAEETSQHHDPQ